jgi:hypothetical protein
MSMHIVVTTPCEASVMLDLINVVMKERVLLTLLRKIPDARKRQT